MQKQIKIFPGIDFIYNDINLDGNPKFLSYDEDVLVINYCQFGRVECEMADNHFCHLGAGDLSLHTGSKQINEMAFPLKEYRGISIIVDLKEIGPLNNMLKNLNINLVNIINNLKNDKYIFIIRLHEILRYIFNELYVVPKEIQLNYMKLKFFEILLYISTVNIDESIIKDIYFKKSDIDTVKNIRSYLTNNLDKHITLKELSKRYNISLTIMKNCFKNIYGMPIYTFIRSYKMNTASVLLKNTNRRITDIALNIGYNNPSKFSSAFKADFGISPLEYRKQNDYME